MKDTRRGFLKKLGIGFGGSMASSIPFISNVEASNNFNLEEEINKWHPYYVKRVFNDNHNFLLDSEEYQKLKTLITYINKKDERFHNRKERDLIWAYSRIYYGYHKNRIDDEINKITAKYDYPNNIAIEAKIRFKKRALQGRNIVFSEINERFANSLYGLCIRYDVNPRLMYIIALIENEFGKSNISNKRAVGQLQVMRSAIEDIEEFYDLKPKYKDLKKKDKLWRELITGVLYVKYLTKMLNLKTLSFNSNPSDVEISWVVIAYNAGPKKIMLGNGRIPKESEEYIEKSISAKNYKFIFTKNEFKNQKDSLRSS